MEPNDSPRVSVVVAIYNRIGITIPFLRQFGAVRYPNYEIVIVDDGSTDGSADTIEREFPSVRLVRTAGDLWWSKAMNLGVRDALGRGAAYILTINDDVAVEPGFLEALVSYAQQHPRTLVGSLIYEYSRPERLWYAGGKIAWLRGDLLHRSSLDEGVPEWLTAMGTLIPAQAFAEVGFYDEDHFPQYTADADFSLRARTRGYALAVAPRSTVWNQSEQSTQRILRARVTARTFLLPLRSKRSDSLLSMRRTLYRRHWPAVLRPVAFLAYYGRFLLKQTKRLLVGLLRRSPAQ